MNITETQAKLFAERMAQKMFFVLIEKSDAFFTQWIAAGFDLVRAFGAKVPSGAEFTNDFATTVGGMVLMPKGTLTPTQRVLLVTHEAQHVNHFYETKPQQHLNLPGGLGMWWLYLVEPEARVRYEIDACSAEMEVAFATGGPARSPDEFAMVLEGGYALGPNEVQLARLALEQRQTAVQHGIVSTPAGRKAIEALREIAPDALLPAFR